MNPEIYSYLIPRALELGAKDIYLTNIIMKKNRPGIKINILCDKKSTYLFEQFLFNETTTLGIRKISVDRVKLDREFVRIKTKFGEVTIKVAYKDGKILKYSPEYEECKKIAISKNIPIKDVYNEIMITTDIYINK